MRLLWYSLATDDEDPILGFSAGWIRAMARQVEAVHVITMRAGRIGVPDNVRVHSVGKEKGYSEPRRAVEFYRHLLQVLRHDRVDVCFSHMIPIFTVLAAPVLKATGIPIVTWYAHPRLTLTLKLAHHLSDRMVASLETAYPYRKDKLVVVGQGIDTDLFAPGRAEPEEPPMILCVGRLSPVKDHPTLLRAAAQLRRRLDRPFRVVILGGAAGPQDQAYVRHLRDLVRDLGLQESVRFEAPVPQRDLPTWYRSCTMHVNLTPTGSGDKVAWEAMACGRPCLAANEGFRDTLGLHSGTLLFRHGNPEDLAQRIERVLRLPAGDRERIGSDLRPRVIEHHGIDRLMGKILDVICESGRREGSVR